MKSEQTAACAILEQLSDVDLWNIGVKEICHAIARGLDSREYGLVRRRARSDMIELRHGITERRFLQRVGHAAKPYFIMSLDQDTYRFYFLDVHHHAMDTRERTSILTILKMMGKTIQMRNVSKERIVETQIINQLNLNVTTALDEHKIVTTLETAARKMLGIDDIYLFYIINDVATGSKLTLHLTDIPKKTYDQLFRIQQIFTLRMRNNNFTRMGTIHARSTMMTFIPFTIKNELRGFFIIFKDILKKNKTYGITRLRFLANQAALAIERIDLFRALNRTLKESQGIQELVKIMLSSVDLSSLFNEILQRAQKILGFNRILFSLLDPKSDCFKRVAGVGISASKFKRAQAVHPPRATMESLFLNRFRISNSYHIPARAVDSIKSNIKAYELYSRPRPRYRLAQIWDPGDIFISPVYSKSRALVAILSLDKPMNNLVPTIEQVRLLETFGDFFGMAIENAQLFEKIEKLSNTDELTGILNYRFLREHIQTLIEKARTPFTLVLIDLDDFKLYNDRFGHVHGDEVLHSFAQNLTAWVGKRGYVVRYGGDEFILLFPNMSAAQTKRIMQGIQRNITRRMKAKRSTLINFTFGTASFPAHGHDLGSLIDRADNILYERKAKKKR
ncbi:diguanylate cyclase [candidate division WOR-3 bacterium]|nr:diguanylate cyclase [candidate division WOR-3 bacterium]